MRFPSFAKLLPCGGLRGADAFVEEAASGDPRYSHLLSFGFVSLVFVAPPRFVAARGHTLGFQCPEPLAAVHLNLNTKNKCGPGEAVALPCRSLSHTSFAVFSYDFCASIQVRVQGIMEEIGTLLGKCFRQGVPNKMPRKSPGGIGRVRWASRGCRSAKSRPFGQFRTPKTNAPVYAPPFCVTEAFGRFCME